MKIAEILRQLADVMDAEEAERTGHATTQNIAPDLNAQAGTDSPDEIYVGPLQQKHELLKKATGVENNVDQFAADDELAQMQQNAGLPSTTVININTAAPAESVKQVDTAILSPLADLTDSD